jgi:hypothetical protein
MATKMIALCVILTALTVATASCGNKNSTANGNSAPASSPPPPKVGFEADLEYVRKGQYTYVWVFSRKDGKEIDKEDGAYLRTNAPQVVDWVITDGGKRVIAGTNFDLALGNLELLKKRFVVEDYTDK